MSLTVIIPPTDVSPTTGTGNAVLATSPTLTTPISASLTSPAATNLTLAGGAGTSSIILTPAGTGGVGIGTITPAQKLSVNGTMQWAQTADAGYSGYLTNASTDAAYNPAITRNLIGSTGSTYTIAHGDMDAYAGIQFGVSGTTTNAGNISFFAASGTFATNESVTPVARMFIANTGDVSISSTTASSSAITGALQVAGGIGAAGASYFGGSISFPSDKGIISTVNNGRLFLDGSANQNGGSIILYGDAHPSFPSQNIYTANTHVYKNINGTQQLSLSLTDATFAGAVTASKFASDASSSFSALTATGVRLEANASWGGVLSGYGTTNDVSIFNKSGALVLSVPTGTIAATFAGAVTAPSATILDAAASTATVLTVRTQNSTTFSSSVLTIIGDRGTTDSTYNLINANNNVISGQFLVRDSGNVVNTNNSYGAISDIKLKENIVDATSKLEKLNQVRIVNFNRIGNEQKQLGVIAQELEQIFPSMIEEAIDRDAEGNDLGTTTKSVKYSVFVPMLIKAMQELTARLAAVEAK